MNTSKKITIRGPKGVHTITYPTVWEAQKARAKIALLKNTRITNVPCDIETGKTEKMVLVQAYQPM